MTVAENLISITLVTRNRPGSLVRALSSVREQSEQPYEILVGDDSTPEHADEVRAVVERYDARYVPGPKRGLAANRNHLVAVARGTHIRTMDDDHEFIDEHWRHCVDAVRADPESIWVIGERTIFPDRVLRPCCPGQLTARGCSEPPRDPDHCWSLADGATIYPRNVFDRGNRLAEMFPFGQAYLEFGSRLHWLGYRIRYLPSTYIIHHTNESIARQDSVWHGNQSIIAASRIFAAMTHAFVYQPTIANRIQAVGECVKEVIRRPKSSLATIRSGIKAYNEHRQTVFARAGPAALQGVTD